MTASRKGAQGDGRLVREDTRWEAPQGAPVDQRLAAVDRVRLVREPAVRLVQNKAGRDAQRRLGAFHAVTSSRRAEAPARG